MDCSRPSPRLAERLETCGGPPAAFTTRSDAFKGRAASLTERREGCTGQVAGIARDLERRTGHLAALTELRGSYTGRVAGLTRGRGTCGGRGAGLAGGLGRCTGQGVGITRNLDALDLPLAGVTALWRLLLRRWCWHGGGGRWGRGAAGGEEALGEGAVELLAGVEVIRLILLAQVAGGAAFARAISLSSHRQFHVRSFGESGVALALPTALQDAVATFASPHE